MEQEAKYLAAKRQVAKIKDFYIHLTIYLLVISMLFLINLSGGGPWWFLWVVFGWGIAIVAHAVGTFGFAGTFGSEWEKKKIDEIMKKP